MMHLEHNQRANAAQQEWISWKQWALSHAEWKEFWNSKKEHYARLEAEAQASQAIQRNLTPSQEAGRLDAFNRLQALKPKPKDVNSRELIKARGDYEMGTITLILGIIGLWLAVVIYIASQKGLQDVFLSSFLFIMSIVLSAYGASIRHRGTRKVKELKAAQAIQNDTVQS